MHIHIGHTFFGAGNFGDDLMLGGFLRGIAPWADSLRVSCAIAHDLASQRLRFPTIEWHGYTPQTRAMLIDACDIWLGLGGGVLCRMDDSWLLADQLVQLKLCRRLGKPAFFLGCGIDDRTADLEPGPRRLIEAASWIWTRDSLSQAALSRMGFTRTAAGADLSHLALRDMPAPAPTAGETGFVLKLEEPDLRRVDQVAGLLADAAAQGPVSWLVQEVRALPGSEETLLAAFPPALTGDLDIRRPDYAGATLAGLVAAWGCPEKMLSSRFHGVIVGAWRGSRVVAFERAQKLAGIAADLQIPSLATLPTPERLREAFARAERVDRRLLSALADQAEASCHQFIMATQDARPEAWR